jgi:hypothetical protein
LLISLLEEGLREVKILINVYEKDHPPFSSLKGGYPKL